MSLHTEITDKLLNAFPDGFDFYHIGRVEPIKDAGTIALSPADLQHRICFAFSLQGDIRGSLLLLIDESFALNHGLDASAEMGNILASRFAMKLNSDFDLDVLISPPINISRERAAKLIELTKNDGIISLQQDYQHGLEDSLSGIRLLAILSRPQEKRFQTLLDFGSPETGSAPEVIGNA